MPWVGALVGVSRRSRGDLAWHQGSRPEARVIARGLSSSENNASPPSGLRHPQPGSGPGNPVLGRQSLSPRGRRVARVEGAPRRRLNPGLVALMVRNELFAGPGVGEDEPVIIFKFAIIDLGKSYCDKNELIIKFISEINSAAIKQRAVRPSRPPSPRAKPGLAPLEAGAWVTTIMSSPGPLFRLSQRGRPAPGAEAQELR